MVKVLFIRCHHNSSRVFKEAKSVSKHGYDVDLFLWNRDTNNTKITTEKYYNKYEYGLKAPYGKYRLFFFWIIWWNAIFHYLMKNQYDIVHVCGFDSYIPAILGKFKGYRIIYDIFDFFGESMPASTPIILKKSISAFERYLIQFADAVIIVDEFRKEQLKKAKIGRLEIIMNCVSDEIENIFQKKDNRNVVFRVFYGGMLSRTRGLIQLIESIKDKQDIQLIIAGSGEDENMIKNIIKNLGNINFIGQITHKEALVQTYQADVIFAYYDPIIPNNKLASPNKLFEAMMCATPIIVNEETTMANIVKEEKCGVIVPYCDIPRLKSMLIQLKNNHEYCTILGKNGRIAFEKKYNWDIMEQRLVNLYHSLTVCTQ